MIRATFLVLFLFVLISGCTFEIDQDINLDGLSTLSIKYRGDIRNYSCKEILETNYLFDLNCREVEGGFDIIGKRYLSNDAFKIERENFKTSYFYERGEILNFIEDISFDYSKEDYFEEIESQNSFVLTNFESITSKNSFNEINSNREKTISISRFNFVNFTILIIILLTVFGSLFLLYKKYKNGGFNELSLEEKKCKQYILKYKKNYSKGELFNGLMSFGVNRDIAIEYINKYY